MSESDYLAQLETLLDEFFSSQSTNQRKHEIEQMLGVFSQQMNAWQLCSYFLVHTENTHVMMFVLNVYERLANSMWPGKCVLWWLSISFCGACSCGSLSFVLGRGYNS